MNSKRSMWKVLLGVVGVGLLVTNCTLKTESDTDDDDTGCTPGKKKNGCVCSSDNSVSYQICKDDGTYDACYCTAANAGGGSSGGGSSGGGSSGGASSGGASSGGANSSTAGKGGATSSGGSSAAGEGGEGGATLVIDPDDCYDCLNQLCTPEWDACVLEDENNPQDPVNAPGDYCLSSDGKSGQIKAILDCIDDERMNGLVKREAVRACGSSLGQSSDPSFFLWPPTQMTAATAGLMNCMADAPDETEPGAWADSKNIPTSGSPKPWLNMTCAKLSCTSAQ